MDPAALALAPGDWLRAAVGTALFLLPGLAAADRLLPGVKARWALAPVLSATLYPLTAVLLGFAGLPVRPAVTVLIGLAWTAVFARHRAAQWLSGRVAA